MEVHLSMPVYVAEVLRQFKHIWTGKTKDQHYTHATPNYGAKVQYAQDVDKSRPANKEDEKLSNKLLDLSCITAVLLTVSC